MVSPSEPYVCRVFWRKSELTRAGVYVKTAEDKPQAADWALKRQIEHSMSMRVDWDRDKASGRHADLWVPLIEVENGEVPEKDSVPKGRAKSEDLETDDGLFSVTDAKEDGDYGREGILISRIAEVQSTRQEEVLFGPVGLGLEDLFLTRSGKAQSSKGASDFVPVAKRVKKRGENLKLSDRRPGSLDCSGSLD
ncbi:hypothetical protein D5086_004665 [Populus alba]|uniref:Uncharacterized protein n=1 Tax=Populus alba TaxID=43335 RepID=A0ACC4CS83_POPAL